MRLQMLLLTLHCLILQQLKINEQIIYINGEIKKDLRRYNQPFNPYTQNIIQLNNLKESNQIIDSLNIKSSDKKKQKKKCSPKVKPINISFNYYDNSIVEQYRQEYVDTIQIVISDIQKIVFVYPKTDILNQTIVYDQKRQVKENNTCNAQPIVSSDLHIDIFNRYINKDRKQFFAEGRPCILGDGMPISGEIDIQRNIIDDYGKIDAIKIIKHEFLHILGFHDAFRDKYQDYIVRDIDFNSLNMMNSPNMMNYIKSLNLTNQQLNLFKHGITFSDYSFGHFHKKLYSCGELMIPMFFFDSKQQITKLTAMYLADLGIYAEIKTDHLPDLECPKQNETLQ